MHEVSKRIYISRGKQLAASLPLPERRCWNQSWTPLGFSQEDNKIFIDSANDGQLIYDRHDGSIAKLSQSV